MPDNQVPQDPEDTADKIIEGEETMDKSVAEENREKSEFEESTDKAAAEVEQQDVSVDLLIPDANKLPASSVFGDEPQKVHQQFTTGNELDLLLDSIERLEIFNIPLPMDTTAGNYDNETFPLNGLDILISSLIEFDQLAGADALYMEDPNQPSCSHGPPRCISTTMRHSHQHRPYTGHAMNLCHTSSPPVVGRPMADRLTEALQQLGFDLPDNTNLQRIVAAKRHPLSCPFNANANSTPARLVNQPNPKNANSLYTNVATGTVSVREPIIPTEPHRGTPSDDEDDDYEVIAPDN